MASYEELLKLYQDKIPAYNPSQTVIDAENALKLYQQNKPGEYSSKYDPQIEAALAAIQNRKNFSYDPNSDAGYLQAKDQFINSGRQAMRDTTGQIAAMSGGYGSSYAATAGNQAFNEQMKKINDILPAMQQNAFSAYNARGQQMADNLATLQGMDSADYTKHLNGLNDYNTGLEMLLGQYDTAKGNDLAQYQTETTKLLNLLQEANNQANYDAEHAPVVKSGGNGGKDKQLWGNDEYKRALYLADTYGDAKAKSYIIGLGLPKDQEAALLRKAGVYGTNTNSTTETGNTTPPATGKTTTPSPFTLGSLTGLSDYSADQMQNKLIDLILKKTK